MNRILLTGAAGFIGFHVAGKLLSRGDEVVGVDCLNDYYDVQLKQARLENLQQHSGFTFRKLDIADRGATTRLMASQRWDAVINLAAQVGVRYSAENPMSFVDSNVTGFMNVMEGARAAEVGHFVYASSSSVYGANSKVPFSVHDNVDHPISFYAATKRANELFAHAYSDLNALPTSGLRFFTVYGPWGRPDMAIFKFTKAILSGEPIPVYNFGRMQRDFTYVDDVANAIVRVTDTPPKSTPNWSTDVRDPSLSRAPFRVYNVGNHSPVELMHLIRVIEGCLGVEAKLDFMPMQPGDVPMTYADVDTLVRDMDYLPATSIEDGVSQFVQWYRQFYKFEAEGLRPTAA